LPTSHGTSEHRRHKGAGSLVTPQLDAQGGLKG